MKGRVWLTVFLLLFVCLASTAFAEQVVEVWKYPLAGLEEIAANAGDGSVWVVEAGGTKVAHLGPDLQEVAGVEGFAGANAIAANSADGSCWVGDCCLGQVVHLAADGTELSRTPGFREITSLSANSADGSCWVADCRNQSVTHLAADGSFLSSIEIGAAMSVAVDPDDGTCWAGERCGDRVVHLQENPDYSISTLSSTSDFPAACSMSVDSANGAVWIADRCHNDVTHLQEGDGSTVTLSATGLSNPWSVSGVSDDSTCWVGDTGTDQVIHLDAAGSVDMTSDEFHQPFAVSVDDSDQSFWVLAEDGIAHLAVVGEVLDTLQREPTFAGPAAVAADPNDGSSWVADCEAYQLLHVTADGDVIAIPLDLEFGRPVLVAVDPVDGSVWVAQCDHDYNRVIHLAADGSEITHADVCCPVALAVDPNDGSCWVADNSDECGLIQVSPEDGSILFGQCLPYPSALAVDPNDSSVWLGLSPGYYYYAPAADIEDSDWIIHFAVVPDEDPNLISETPVPAPANCLVVDPGDSSCLAALGEGLQIDFLARSASGDPAALEGDAYAVPLLRITETPSGPATALLGGFMQPRGLSIDPADRSIWVADTHQVAHMASDGAVLSRTGGYCCALSVSVDTGDGSCWAAARESTERAWDWWDGGRVVDLAVVPEADFTASADTGVAPFEVSFSDLSTGHPTSWAWTFGDGGTSAEQNPTHTYGLGHYTVSLTVEGAGGSDTETKVNYIYAGAIAPTADFSATPTTGHAPLSVTFEDLSTNNPTEWLWSFGDGATSDEQNPTHEYQEAGVYTVSLVVSNSQGLDVETKTDYITVQQALAAAFSTDVTRGPFPLEVHFTDESVGDVTSWLWTFGDGGTSTAQNPIHYYEDPGFYTVTLMVWSGGVSASVTQSGCIAVGFKDTPADHWAFMQEIACSEAGIVQGYWDGSYDPAGLVNRSQMATFIARALAGGDEHVPSGPATPSFTDVAADQWAYRYIEYCAAHGIVLGYEDGSYHPEDEVNRGQMAVYMARTVASPEGMEDFTPPATATFWDVTSTNDWLWCYKYVEYLAALDPPVVTGYPDGSYRPELSVTRDQMAVFMQRAFDLPIPGSTP